MSAVEALVQTARQEAREKRARAFREMFTVGPTTRILDLGSADGSAIAAVLAGTGAQPNNIFIADSDPALVGEGQRRFGFTPVTIPTSGRLPFDDGYFDIVYCSSVIERVTAAPGDETWYDRTSDIEFERRARAGQRQFANEIRRLAKSYFVQTPNKWFPLESHTWLPFVGYLPRTQLLRVVAWTNRYWIKRTQAEWFLLTAADMQELFPDAVIRRERFMGLTKSIMAMKAQ
jgi:hypothetical protein